MHTTSVRDLRDSADPSPSPWNSRSSGLTRAGSAALGGGRQD